MEGADPVRDRSVIVLETNTGQQTPLTGGVRLTGLSKTHSVTVVVDDLQVQSDIVIGYQGI